MDYLIPSQNQSSRARDVSPPGEIRTTKDKGIFVGVEDDEDDNEHCDAKDDGLDDIWKEMTFAMECSKVLFCISICQILNFTFTLSDSLVKILQYLYLAMG